MDSSEPKFHRVNGTSVRPHPTDPTMLLLSLRTASGLQGFWMLKEHAEQLSVALAKVAETMPSRGRKK